MRENRGLMTRVSLNASGTYCWLYVDWHLDSLAVCFCHFVLIPCLLRSHVRLSVTPMRLSVWQRSCSTVTQLCHLNDQAGGHYDTTSLEISSPASSPERMPSIPQSRYLFGRIAFSIARELSRCALLPDFGSSDPKNSHILTKRLTFFYLQTLLLTKVLNWF